MKSKCKLISIALVILLMLTNISTIAFAAKNPTVTIDTVEASSGDTIDVAVTISGNTGIAGAIVKISYDSELTLVDVKNGEAFSGLSFTKPGKFNDPVSFLWDSESEVSKKNGEILILSFKVSDNAEAGDFLNIKASCASGDFYDSNMETVDVSIVNGGVNICKEGNETSFFSNVFAYFKNVISVIIKFMKNILGGK